MKRKSDQATKMFQNLVNEMNNSENFKSINKYIKKETIPEWLLMIK
jgi:hypothetical protein